MNTAEVELAIELFLKPLICGEVPSKSTIRRESRNRQGDGDPAVDRLEAIVLDQLLGAPDALCQAIDAGAEAAVGMVEHAFEEGIGLVGAQFLDQQRQLLGADAGRADHGAQVAVERLGQAGVEQQQAPQLVARLAALDQLQDRQADAFVEDLGGCRIVGPRGATADIGLVGTVAGEGCKHAANEHRSSDHPVRQVVAAGGVGVVQQEHVFLFDRVLEIAQDGAHGEAAAAGMDRNAVGLADQRAAGIGDEAGKVVALAEDRRARRARHHPAHLVRDVIEPVLHEGQGDGMIEDGGTSCGDSQSIDVNQEIVARVDFEQVAGACEGGRGALLDQQRTFELAAGAQIGAVIDRHVAPAVPPRIDPDVDVFPWLRRGPPGLRGRRAASSRGGRGRRPGVR